MSSVIESAAATGQVENNRFREAGRLPLLIADDPGRVLVWGEHGPITAGAFMADVQHVAAQLPARAAAVNLCEDRYAFLVTFCALLVRGQTNLLPASRAPEAIDAARADQPGSYAVGEQARASAPPGYLRVQLRDGTAAPEPVAVPLLDPGQCAVIGYTSGSTGRPTPSAKTWGSFSTSNAANLAMLRAALPWPFHLVATVPPQHMYGMETSVLLPLLGGVSVHGSRPLFPADIAAALAAVPAPRVLATTPVHLRALVASGVPLPPLAGMLSATAPMPAALAARAEERYGAPLLEMFGSTETCVFATRRSALETRWRVYPGVKLRPQPDGTVVDAPQLAAPVTLADLVTLHEDGASFELRGRHADQLEIAGKRASLGALTQRLLAIPGVEDGVVLQLDEADAMGVRRVAALAVAPALDEQQILDALRRAIDPVFLPRPLRRVAALPRNDTGKLPRAAVLALLKAAG